MLVNDWEITRPNEFSIEQPFDRIFNEPTSLMGPMASISYIAVVSEDCGIDQMVERTLQAYPIHRPLFPAHTKTHHPFTKRR